MFPGSNSPVPMLISGKSGSFLLLSCVSSPAHDRTGLRQYLPGSKFCVLSILLCFTNLLNSYFMPGIVLGAKDQKNE